MSDKKDNPNRQLANIGYHVGEDRLVFTAKTAGGRLCEIPAEDVVAFCLVQLASKLAIAVAQPPPQQRGAVLTPEMVAKMRSGR